MPFGRYTPFQPVDLPDRTWPAKKITQAPRWLSTDLRDATRPGSTR
jgi:2-isopropylmalate synthase